MSTASGWVLVSGKWVAALMTSPRVSVTGGCAASPACVSSRAWAGSAGERASRAAESRRS